MVQSVERTSEMLREGEKKTVGQETSRRNVESNGNN